MKESPGELDRLYSLISRNSDAAGDVAAIYSISTNPISWSGLRSQVDRSLSYLRSVGIGRGDKLAIVMPNGPEMASVFLAAAAGATAAPLNPAYKKEDFDFYLDDLQARAVIVDSLIDSPVREAAQIRGINIIELETAGAGCAGEFHLTGAEAQSPAPEGTNEADDVALILHTSGTTSRPKMVPLTSRNICRSAYNVKRAVALSDTDRCLNIMPLFHIHGLIANVMGTVAAQGAILCTPGFDDTLFFDWYAEFSPSWYSAVPTMHQAILRAASGQQDLIKKKPLRFIRSSSASLAPAVMTELEQTFHCPVIEAYGMTEAAHQMASNPLPPAPRKAKSVGVSAGPEIAILDEQGDQLAPSSIGEIAIRGDNVTPGYVGNSKANAEAFTNGWFRTGDQGYLDQDSYLFLTGRLKEIINRGGEKVAPREIDEALMAHPAIHQAVAFAMPHDTLGEDVAVAVVLADSDALTVEEIREYAFNHLADFKVPSRVLLVEEIPKGPTGKLQRIGLADALKNQLETAYESPANELERLLADIISDVLDQPKVGAEDNFFALGGDSLRGTQVVARVSELLNVTIPIVTLFRKPTVRQLAIEIGMIVGPENLQLLMEILTELEGMSEEEAQAVLQQQKTDDTPT